VSAPRYQLPAIGDAEPLTLDELKRAYIVEALVKYRSISAAAQALGVFRSSLQRSIARLGIDWKNPRSSSTSDAV